MIIKIKSLANFSENYNRFGKLLPKEITEINIAKYFNCNPERELYIFEKLKNDKKIKVELLELLETKVEKQEMPKVEKQEIKYNEKQEIKIETRGRKPGAK